MNTFAQELLVLVHRENKQAAEEIHSFPPLKLSKHEIDSTRHFSVNGLGMIPKDALSQKCFLH